MSNKRIGIRLKYENRGEYFTVDGEEIRRDTDQLVSILKRGIKVDAIKSGTIIKDKIFTKYEFKMEEYSEQTEDYENEKLVIRVLNKEKDMIKSLPAIEAYCNAAIKIKKINRTRLAAGILAAVVLATTAGPFMVKGLEKILQKEQAFNDAIVAPYSSMMTEYEERQKAIEEYEMQQHEEAQQERDAIEEARRGWSI